MPYFSSYLIEIYKSHIIIFNQMISAPSGCTRHHDEVFISPQREEEMRMIQCEAPPRASKRIIQKLLHPTPTFDYSCHGRNWIISDKVTPYANMTHAARTPVTDSDRVKIRH